MTPGQRGRHDELVREGDVRTLTTDEATELTTLERVDHAFRLMCTRTAPLNPIALGYAWGETISHAAIPGRTAELRTGGMVRMDGETMTLMAATQRIAIEARRGVALADWSGSAGRLGDVAGLEHPPRNAVAPAAAPEHLPPAQEPAKTRKQAPPAAIGDLFD